MTTIGNGSSNWFTRTPAEKTERAEAREEKKTERAERKETRQAERAERKETRQAERTGTEELLDGKTFTNAIGWQGSVNQVNKADETDIAQIYELTGMDLTMPTAGQYARISNDTTMIADNIDEAGTYANAEYSTAIFEKAMLG